MAALGMVKKTLVFLMARSEGYLESKIDQKTHPRNQNQVPRAATSFLAGETVGFCADAHAGPIWRPHGASSAMPVGPSTKMSYVVLLHSLADSLHLLDEG